jgi:hypothetical protein
MILMVIQMVQSYMPRPLAMPLMEQIGFPASLLLMVLISLVLVNFDLNPVLDYLQTYHSINVLLLFYIWGLELVRIVLVVLIS